MMLVMWGFLIVVLALLAVSLIFAARSAWCNRDVIRNGWISTGDWQRHAMTSGFMLYLAISILEGSPTGSEPVMAFILNILDAVANGLFLIGLIAFLENCFKAGQLKRNAQQDAQADGPPRGGPAA